VKTRGFGKTQTGEVEFKANQDQSFRGFAVNFLDGILEFGRDYTNLGLRALILDG
jgi:hypothetical protein